MKTILRLIIILSVATTAHAQDRLSRIGGTVGGPSTKPADGKAYLEAETAKAPIATTVTLEQFRAVCLDTIMQTYTKATDGITQKIRYTPYAGGWLRQSAHVAGTRQIRILQTIDTGVYLASAGQQTIAVKLNSAYVDGDTLSLVLSNTGETYTYTTVLGARKDVRIYTQAPALTVEEVITAFKNGMAFLIPRETPADAPCIDCSATGFVTVKTGGSTRKSLCKKCGGARQHSVTANLIYSVSIAKN